MEYISGEDEEEGVKDDIMKKIKSNDPYELRLKSIEQDKCK